MFFVTEVQCLGRKVGNGYHGITEETRQKLLSIKTPTTRTELQSVIGLLSYSRRYIPNFARLSQKLTTLLVDDTPYNTIKHAWTTEHESQLRKLIHAIANSQAIQTPKQGPVDLYIDSYKYTVAYLLGQKNKLTNGRYANGYLAMNSKTIPKHMLDDSMAHKEAFALQYAIEELYPLLLGREIHVHTDNEPVHNCLLKQSPASNKKTALTELILSAQSLNIKPHLVHSKDNIADYNTRNAFTYLISNIMPSTHEAKGNINTQTNTITTSHSISNITTNKPPLPANLKRRLEILFSSENTVQYQQYYSNLIKNYDITQTINSYTTNTNGNEILKRTLKNTATIIKQQIQETITEQGEQKNETVNKTTTTTTQIKKTNKRRGKGINTTQGISGQFVLKNYKTYNSQQTKDDFCKTIMDKLSKKGNKTINMY